ncbi:MAG: hypothetical protein ACW98Y_05540 [Candidatus Thorarchaeota archaeon]
MPLQFPPIILDLPTLITLIAAIVADIFLVLWGISLRSDAKVIKHKSLILILSFLVLISDILNMFLPSVEYVSGPEFYPMELVIGYLFSLFRYGYISAALAITLGIILIAFGRDNKVTYRLLIIATGIFVIVGFILLAFNNANYRFLVWTGSPDAITYSDTISPLLSSIGRVISDVRLFFFIFIGIQAKQYPLLFSGAVTLSISILFMVLGFSLPGLILVISSLILFVLSVIVVHFLDRRGNADELEVA